MPTRSVVIGTKEAVKTESHSSALTVRLRIREARVCSIASLTSSGQVKGKVTVRTYEALVGRAMSGYKLGGVAAKLTSVSKVSNSEEEESLAEALKVMGHERGLELVAAAMISATC
jgi:hypothetical protein